MRENNLTRLKFHMQSNHIYHIVNTTSPFDITLEILLIKIYFLFKISILVTIIKGIDRNMKGNYI